MCVGGVCCAELVPNEPVGGNARKLLGIRLRFRLSSGVVDFGYIVDGVGEGCCKISGPKDLPAKQCR